MKSMIRQAIRESTARAPRAIAPVADAASIGAPVAVSGAPVATIAAAPPAPPQGAIVIRIDVDGGTARTLWTDAIDLPALGRVGITRASVVEFDGASQTWFVDTPEGKRVARGFAKRTDALAWEHEWATKEVVAGR